MAERLLSHALNRENELLKSLTVKSAGVAAYPGEPASENAVLALKKVGIPLNDHWSQPVNPDLLASSLTVFCMTESHRQLLHARFPQAPEQMYLMREFLPAETGHEIPDPFGADLAAYEACRDSMVEAIPPIIQFLKSIR